MKVGAYKGYAISVLMRDEHCPLHVHVRGFSDGSRVMLPVAGLP